MTAPRDTHPVPASEPGASESSATRTAGAERGDQPTRLLCAAAHRRVWFAEAIIRFYLIEQVGSVPPSPGLTAQAVLRDAVAAHTRRRLRDAVVLVLLVALLVLDPAAVALWVAVAITLRVRYPVVARTARYLAVIAALGLLLLVVAAKALTGIGWPWGSRVWWPSLLVAGGLLAVLMADEWVAQWFLRMRFQPDRFVADAATSESGLERWLRSRGQRPFAEQLARVVAADEHNPDNEGMVDVIVHRTESPFVGGGFAPSPQPVRVHAKKGMVGKPIDIADLHAHLIREVTDGLIGRTQVVISAEHLVRLVRARRTPFALRVFEHMDKPPVRHLPPADVAQVVREEIDGARFYSVFRDESWDRNVVVSVYVHVSARLGGLQVEVTPCILPPVDAMFDEVDERIRMGERWAGVGAADFVCVPLSLTGRRGRIVRVLRTLTPRHRHHNYYEPWKYGAGRSLREGVSRGVKSEYWYQAAHAGNTAGAISDRLFRETAAYLEKYGYDVSRLRKDASRVVNNHNINISGGHFTDATIANGDIYRDSGRDDSTDEKPSSGDKE